MSDGGFEFSSENAETAKAVIGRYPAGRQQSAVMPLLDLAQRQNGGWLPQAAIEYVADFLDMPRIRAQEVATFYTMYNLKPVGKHVVGVCTTTPCWLRGSAGGLPRHPGHRCRRDHGRRVIQPDRGRMPRRLLQCADDANR